MANQNEIYRIKEHLGMFIVEQKYDFIRYERTFWSSLMPFFFKQKEIKERGFKAIGYNGYGAYSLNPVKKFKTKEKAIKFISQLEPKYHYLDEKTNN